MFGRHYDTRVQRHFVHILSKVPYLDTQIANISNQSLRQSKRTRDRTLKVMKAIQRAKQKSQLLQQGLKASRLRQQTQQKQFMDDLQNSQKVCLERQRQTWNNFSQDKRQSRINTERDQKYLNGLLATNSTKAASRLTSVRRWNYE